MDIARLLPCIGFSRNMYGDRPGPSMRNPVGRSPLESLLLHYDEKDSVIDSTCTAGQ